MLESTNLFATVLINRIFILIFPLCSPEQVRHQILARIRDTKQTPENRWHQGTTRNMLLPRAIPNPHVGGVLGRFALCYDPRRTPTRRTCTLCYWILARIFHPKRVLFCMPAKSRHTGVFMFFLGYRERVRPTSHPQVVTGEVLFILRCSFKTPH